MDSIKFRTVGNSVGIILPKEYLEHMNVESGDEVSIAKEPDGKIMLSPYDPEFAATMEAHRQVKKRYRNALKELADK